MQFIPMHSIVSVSLPIISTTFKCYLIQCHKDLYSNIQLILITTHSDVISLSTLVTQYHTWDAKLHLFLKAQLGSFDPINVKKIHCSDGQASIMERNCKTDSIVVPKMQHVEAV